MKFHHCLRVYEGVSGYFESLDLKFVLWTEVWVSKIQEPWRWVDLWLVVVCEVVQELNIIYNEALELVLVKCNEFLLESWLVLCQVNLVFKAFRCSSIVAESNSAVQSNFTRKIFDQQTLTLDHRLDFTWIIVIDNKILIKGCSWNLNNQRFTDCENTHGFVEVVW